jgi:DNA helicase INO80
MILDEAQAIKSSNSARWKTLLGFSCRNRLLLTGTPIQNNMQGVWRLLCSKYIHFLCSFTVLELWALLHFIMPGLFDSHDEFSEWFAKDIETHVEKGENSLSEHQVRRLHMILKPFMLRRIKKNVQNELGDKVCGKSSVSLLSTLTVIMKIEKDIYCDLSPRQRALYRGLRANVSVADLLVKASRQGDADSARSLMNLVMQFRKASRFHELIYSSYLRVSLGL